VKFSIYIKILLFSLGLSVFSSLILFGINYYHTQRIIRQHITSTLENKSELILLSIDRFLEERIYDVMDFRTKACKLNDNQCVILKSEMDEFLASHRYFESISFFSTDRKRLVDSDNRNIGKTHTLSTYWPALLHNGTVVDISTSECRGYPVVHVGIAVKNETLVIGYVVARISVDHIYDMFEYSLLTKNDQNLHVELLNQAGKLLYSNKGYFARFSGDHFLKKSNQNNLIQENETQIKSIYFQQNNKQNSENNWVLVLTAQKDSVLQEMKNQGKTSLIIVFNVLLMVFVLSIIFSYQLTKPIRKLTRMAKEFGEGNLAYTSNITSNDEHQILGNTMIEMAQKLEHKIKAQFRLNTILNTQFEKTKEQKRQIMSSIEYAKRIQQALLPSEKDFYSPHYFLKVFYKPRNIVSGDFYFVQHVKTEELEFDVVVVVDCTGHGVPGAFMTIIANSLLNQIITIEKNHNPLTIIKELDFRLSRIFTKYNNQADVNDGMDISVISYDNQNQKLYFCGANQRMLYKKFDGQVHECVGLKTGLGENRVAELIEKGAKTCEIDVEEGDIFMLYTDGIIDQFGNRNTQKFTKKRIVDIMQRYTSPNRTGLFDTLTQTVKDWMSDSEQTDDMLLLSFNPIVFSKSNLPNEATCHPPKIGTCLFKEV